MNQHSSFKSLRALIALALVLIAARADAGAVGTANAYPPGPPVAGESLRLKPAISDTAIARGRSVQLAAERSEPMARKAWWRARALAGEILAGFAPQIVAVNLPGKGRFFRLRIAGLSTTDALQLCRKLNAKGVACLQVPH